MRSESQRVLLIATRWMTSVVNLITETGSRKLSLVSGTIIAAA